MAQILDQHDLVVSSTRIPQSDPSPTESEDLDLEPEELVLPEEEPEQSIEVEWDGNVGPTINEDVEWDDVIEIKD